MNRDNTTHYIYQCQNCKSLWDEEGLGIVRIDGHSRFFCRRCQSEDLQKINASVNENSDFEITA